MVAERRIADRLVMLGRRHRKEEAYKGDAREPQEQQILLEWEEEFYRFAKSNLCNAGVPERHPMSRHPLHFSLAQAFTLVALQHKLGLSTREMVDYLSEHVAALVAVEVRPTRLISHMTFCRMAKRVTHKGLKAASNNMIDDRQHSKGLRPAVRPNPLGGHQCLFAY